MSGNQQSKPACQTDVPFRQHENLTAWTDEERDSLRNETREVKPYAKCDFDAYNMLILGPCKAGKSSLKNTMKSAFIGEVSYQSDAGHEIMSLTRNFTIGPMRDTNGEHLGSFRFADMPGLDFLKVDKDTIGGILDGRIPHNYEILDCVQPELADPNAKNRIHCIVAVLDATKPAMMSSDSSIYQVLRDFRKQARSRGVPFTVVLTHPDEVCTCIGNDLSMMFTCKHMEEAIQSIVIPLEIDPNRVFLVQNYCSVKDVKVSVKVDCLALATLKHLLQYSREYADNWLDSRGL